MATGVTQFILLTAVVIALVMTSLVIPVILLAIPRAVPATKHKHGVTYGVSGVIAMLTPWLSAYDSISTALAIAASSILAALFYWQYSRATAMTVTTHAHRPDPR